MLKLEQRLYQLVISRLEGEKISSSSYVEQAVELVRKGIGGFIVFGGEKDELKNFIDKLQSISEIPLFIASDIERGAGQQIDGATLFSCQMAVAAAVDKNNSDDVKILGDAIKAVADESIDIGINMPLIPVLDVNKNPDNPIICTRAFSDDPDAAAWYGSIYINTLESSGLISCAKHFPGHGDTAIDSHISLPVISKSYQELSDTDLLPFIEAVKTGVSSIMVGHLSIPAFDELPASLSKKIITDLLRKRLGYEGLIMTDALNMHALNEFDNVPSKCINAGVDIILHPAHAGAVVKELRNAVTSGEIKERRIDTAVERVLKFKSKINSIQRSEVDYRKHAELSELISDKSITLVHAKGGVLPLEDIQNTSLVITGDENKHDATPLKKFAVEHINLKDYRDDILKETIVFALFTSVAAWQGSSGVGDDKLNLIGEVIKKSRHSIVISFGSPYVLRHFKEADALIAAYDSTRQAQSSVMKCLKGEMDFMGKLPVKL
jgi:beta-glucosidase-like glycosyl hydrolase